MRKAYMLFYLTQNDSHSRGNDISYISTVSITEKTVEIGLARVSSTIAVGLTRADGIVVHCGIGEVGSQSDVSTICGVVESVGIVVHLGKHIQAELSRHKVDRHEGFHIAAVYIIVEHGGYVALDGRKVGRVPGWSRATAGLGEEDGCHIVGKGCIVVDEHGCHVQYGISLYEALQVVDFCRPGTSTTGHKAH